MSPARELSCHLGGPVLFHQAGFHVLGVQYRGYGWSLGSGVATRLVSEVEPGPATLVTEGAFTSVPAVAAEAYPWLPVRLVTAEPQVALAALREIRPGPP